MVSRKPSKDLRITLESEAYGEASFRSAYIVSFGEKKKKAEALWQLEVQTKERVLDYFQKYNFSTPRLHWHTYKGRIIGLIFPVFPWKIVLRIILSETKYFLDIFRRLEDQATELDKPFFSYLVEHELAIRRFAELELQNEPEKALLAINCLLTGPKTEQT